MGRNINVVSSRAGRTGGWKARLPGGTTITTMPKTLYDNALKKGGKKLARSAHNGCVAGGNASAPDTKPK